MCVSLHLVMILQQFYDCRDIIELGFSTDISDEVDLWGLEMIMLTWYIQIA